MSESRGTLLARKEDLFTALRALEQDHREGVVDGEAYSSARRRYEVEAAHVLERLDALHTVEDTVPPWRRIRWPLATLVVLPVVAVGVVILAVTSLRPPPAHTATAVSTTQPASTVSAATLAAVHSAQMVVRRHPHRVDARLALAAAELQANNSVAADAQYVRAMGIAPRRPEAPTLHALVLSAENKNSAALALLSRVERLNPRYARAWLTDGLIASRRPPGIPRAIRAWRHFLRLQPRGPVATEIRPLLAGLEHARAR